MNSSSAIYGKRRNGGIHGDVPTSHKVVCYMLDIVGYTADVNLSNVCIVEPSCGCGEFVEEIAKRLKQSSFYFHFNAEEAFRHNVSAYDIEADKIAECRERVRKLGIQYTENIQVADFLKIVGRKADIVIGNPPYIRYENIPAETIDYCRSQFATFHYRSDLYIAFFEKSLSILNENGRHCFICSNRWLKNEYGKKLRRYISQSFCLQLVIDMERVNAFQENVSAYPAITLISAKQRNETFGYAECQDYDQLWKLATVQKVVPTDADWTEAFVDRSPDSTLASIEQQGFKIGIGVATGADAVFVSKYLPDEVEHELILPAINARDLRGDKLQWSGNFLLNPYSSNGKLIDLDAFPKAKRYLESHREKLSKRHIASKSPAYWYKTIDCIKPALQSQSKILLPDMSSNSFIFIDNGHFYPLHNIYYITGHQMTKLYVLAAILMSDFVKGQLYSVTTKMNGGTIRWQSQHLRKLLLPDMALIADGYLQILYDSYVNKDVAAINNVMPKLLNDMKSPKTSQRKMLSPIELPRLVVAETEGFEPSEPCRGSAR